MAAARFQSPRRAGRRPGTDEVAFRRAGSASPRRQADRASPPEHATIRGFDLAVEHLPDGAAALAKLGLFFRGDAGPAAPRSPGQAARVIDFLCRRGLPRRRTGRDRRNILAGVCPDGRPLGRRARAEAIVRLNLEFPGLKSPVAVVMEGVRVDRLLPLHRPQRDRQRVVHGPRGPGHEHAARGHLFPRHARPSRSPVPRGRWRRSITVVVSDFKYRPRNRPEFQAWMEAGPRVPRRAWGRRAAAAREAKASRRPEARLGDLDRLRADRLRPFHRARLLYIDYVYTHQYELSYILDPVITVHPDARSRSRRSPATRAPTQRLAARKHELFDKIDEFQCGTTNIDFQHLASTASWSGCGPIAARGSTSTLRLRRDDRGPLFPCRTSRRRSTCPEEALGEGIPPGSGQSSTVCSA